ncbi:MAG: site-2 protease family protein [Christensenellales bacterium]
MIRFRALGVELRLHALVILTLALALAMGITREIVVLLAALCAHELAHLAAARACNLTIGYIDIMPFGGAAHIADIYDAPPFQMIVVALAGPLANLLFAVAGAALGWWGVLRFPDAARVVRVNTILMLFNLLPALPLDGGRVLCAIAGRWLGRRRATGLSVALAHLLAALLLVATAVGFFKARVVNLSFILMSVFLVAASISERNAMLASDASGAVRSLLGGKSLPARAKLVAIDAAAPPACAARFMRKGEVTIFALYEGDEFAGFADERSIAKRAVARQGDA